MSKVVGILWNRNEGDILEEIISKARPLVDHLLVADDASTDNSWDIIRAKKSELDYISRYGETPGSKLYHKSVWQRQSLLEKAIEMFGRDIWIQVIESDLISIETNIKEQIELGTHTYGIAVWWITIEAVRKEWTEEDEKYPNWDKSIQEVMPYGFILEKAPYTWRPLPDIHFSGKNRSPIPRGLAKYGQLSGEWRVRRRHCNVDTPLWGHYNIRGKKHFEDKYAGMDKTRKSVQKRYLCAFTIPKDIPEALFDLNRESWIKGVNLGLQWRSLW